MTRNPIISVIIPTYNREKYVVEAIESVLVQTYKNLEIISDGETGLLVPPGDATALAGAMEQLLTDRDSRLRIGQAGRSRLEEQFTWDQTVGRMNAELLTVIGSLQTV